MPSEEENGGAVRLNGLLDGLVADGWTPGDEAPDSDRIVRVAWDDGSTGPGALSFWDGRAGNPEGPPCWWSLNPIMPLPDGSVLAWREKDA